MYHHAMCTSMLTCPCFAVMMIDVQLSRPWSLKAVTSWPTESSTNYARDSHMQQMTLLGQHPVPASSVCIEALRPQHAVCQCQRNSQLTHHGQYAAPACHVSMLQLFGNANKYMYCDKTTLLVAGPLSLAKQPRLLIVMLTGTPSMVLSETELTCCCLP